MKSRRLYASLILITAMMTLAFGCAGCGKNNKKTTNVPVKQPESQSSAQVSSDVAELIRPGSSETAGSQTNAQPQDPMNAIVSELIYVGCGNNYQAYSVEMNAYLSAEEQVEAYVNAIGSKMGYSIAVDDVNVWNGGVEIDLNPKYAPFDLVNNYWGNGREEYMTYGATETVNTIFDSIAMTLHQHLGSTTEIYFTENNQDVEINIVSPAIKISSLKPYLGSSRGYTEKAGNSQSPVTSRVYDDYTLYIGMEGTYTTYSGRIDSALPVTDKAKYLIAQISDKIGYQIYVDDISSGKGGMTVNFDRYSAPFDLTNTYWGKGTEAYRTYSSEETMYTIFDSIRETLKRYFGTTMDVYFCAEEGDVVITYLSPALILDRTEPYPGSAVVRADRAAEAKKAEREQQKKREQQQKKEQEKQNQTNTVNYVYVGRDGNYDTYEVTVYDNVDVETQTEMLINEIGYRLGYQIMIANIYSGKGGMTIDFDSDSAPFDTANTYYGNGTESYRTYGVEDTAYTIFDSIKMTLKQYYGDSLDIYFTVDDGDIVIDSVYPAIVIDSMYPY